MKHLDTYIAFDLEFNTVNDVSHVIQDQQSNMTTIKKLTALTPMFTQMFPYRALSMA
ncbi:hypothetical protein Z330_01790 [Streptococcus pyogenes ABC020026799]|nr:hypothetical protein Z492_01444 [Streptococcus pyogenes ABC020052558]EZK56859.1 hypothetical protein Z503_01643 [Streptococcus pyogenes ABC020060793]EZK64400.1 hypothetical protein Z484_01305 [Streptococcus pyogenes ABC020047959]EZK64631.1 hypothetical protein Z486_00036 [Streptococcus pyogenes ABC020048541]EZK68422.1 hypothetical protein Z482_01369 [Streptococcus pyogenes ABC020047395]EZK70648.1 hypothetical protein Z475_00036 [Streptococcus pyogenes ABC020044010]EZK72184.1 hypothetical p